MRKPSRTLASATAVILLAAAVPAAAELPVASAPTADQPIPRILYALTRPGPDPGCGEARQPTGSPMLLDWWREWWDAATSQRAIRRTDPDPPTRAPFYLRSPMLSGFFGWGEPGACDDPRRARRRTARLKAPAPARESPDSAAATAGPEPRKR